MSTSSRERAELADLLDRLGPEAPTCCEGWTTAHLAAHLVTRDRRPDSLPGYGVELLGVHGPLPAWSHRLEDQVRQSTPYEELVRRVRAGAPAWSPMGWPGPLQRFSVSEFLIHHEDARRAQPGWQPRALPPETVDDAWRAAQFSARLYTASGRRTVVLRRSDATGTERRIGRGGKTTTLVGEPLELLLWLSGRRGVARVDEGPRPPHPSQAQGGPLDGAD
jgi:uncharacterized protein (TIGR03085 family)